MTTSSLTPSFVRIVDRGNTLYAEIFWPRGELGAPYPQWWDLRTCRFRLNTAPTDEYKQVYQQALNTLEASIKAKNACSY